MRTGQGPGQIHTRLKTDTAIIRTVSTYIAEIWMSVGLRTGREKPQTPTPQSIVYEDTSMIFCQQKKRSNIIWAL